MVRCGFDTTVHIRNRTLHLLLFSLLIFNKLADRLNMNKTGFPELPIKLSHPMVSLYRLLDEKKEHSQSLGEQNSILELQLYLQNICHLARTAYSSSITLKSRSMLEQLMRKSFSLERQLDAMAKHHEWLEGSDTQMLKQVGLIMDALSSENKRLSD